MQHTRQLKKATGGKDVSQINEADVRPGIWREKLLPPIDESKINKQSTVPAVLQDKIVEDVANGISTPIIESRYGVTKGIVRGVLIRRFGSIEAMKKALAAQCFENAIALNEHAMNHVEDIDPAKALLGVKLMVDSGLALDKATVSAPVSVDFQALEKLGQTLERVEKRIQGSDRTVPSAS